MSSTAAPQMPSNRPSHPDVFLTLLAEPEDDRRALNGALLVALALHGILLMITFPSFTSTIIEAADPPKAIRLIPTPRLRPQPPVVQRTRQHTRPTHIVPSLEFDDAILVAKDDVSPVVFDDDLPIFDLPLPDAPSNVRPSPGIAEAPPGRVSAEFVRPVNIHRVEPDYPSLAKRTRLQGDVVIRTIIGRDGSIIEATVEKGLSMGLSEAALRAVKQWRFQPPTWNGHPVELDYVVTVQFRID